MEGWKDGRMERSDSSIPPNTITNNLPFVASLLTPAHQQAFLAGFKAVAFDYEKRRVGFLAR